MLFEQLWCQLNLLQTFAKREGVDDWEDLREAIEITVDDLLDWRDDKHKAYNFAHELYTNWRFNLIYKAKSLPQHTKTTFYNVFNLLRYMNSIYE